MTVTWSVVRAPAVTSYTIGLADARAGVLLATVDGVCDDRMFAVELEAGVPEEESDEVVADDSDVAKDCGDEVGVDSVGEADDFAREICSEDCAATDVADAVVDGAAVETSVTVFTETGVVGPEDSVTV